MPRRKQPATDKPAQQPASAPESLALPLSAAQRSTILTYANLPSNLAERLTTTAASAAAVSFTLDELDELLDYLEGAVYRAKGNEKQKVQRLVAKVSQMLGSKIDLHAIVDDPAPPEDTVYQIKILLQHIDPPIWRRIQTQDCTLEVLHCLIQVAMGWGFEHAYRFEIDGVDFIDGEYLENDQEHVGDTSLSEVIPTAQRRPRFQYEYDFSDGWCHQLIVEELLAPTPGTRYPRCLAGARACPPEDCGGPHGYAMCIEALEHPTSPEHAERLEWLGGAFDPEAFAVDAVNKRYAKMARRKSRS